ncbi:MAG: DevR family CRISPR-associated autoregulator [Bacillota bacterium]
MATVSSLSLSAKVTLDLHNLNNEGTEGNQQQTRMVHIIGENGERAVVNAVSGDMFKHVLVDHLIPLLKHAGQPLSPGALIHDPDRINVLNQDFVDFCEKEREFKIDGKTEVRKALESEIITKMLQDCSLTDIAGALVTRGRSVGRKSVVEFGWVVGLPDKTVTEQYFHVKYAPEGRGGAAGGESVAGKQAIFHRPASSGQYALICSLELNRIGINDITRQQVISKADREKRTTALLQALASTLVEPAGAQRNTQNPHIVACEGVIATSSTPLPAPLFSALSSRYRSQIREIADVLNRMQSRSIRLMEFDSLAEAVHLLQSIAEDLQLPEV